MNKSKTPNQTFKGYMHDYNDHLAMVIKKGNKIEIRKLRMIITKVK